jgi:hypothetical protein
LAQGLLEMITAIGYMVDDDPGVRASDSSYWWFISLSSIWVGWTMVWNQHKLMSIAPWPFLMCVPTINLYNFFLIGVNGPYVSYGHAMLFLFWFIFTCLRQLLIFVSFRDVKEDYAKYEKEWKVLNENEHDTQSLRALERFCVSQSRSTSNVSSRKKRPSQLLETQSETLVDAVNPDHLPFAGRALLNQNGAKWKHELQENAHGVMTDKGKGARQQVDIHESCLLSMTYMSHVSYLWHTCVISKYLQQPSHHLDTAGRVARHAVHAGNYY